MVMLMAATVLAACEDIDLACGADTTLEVQPVQAATIKDIRLSARLTSEGTPLPGRQVSFTLATGPEGTPPRFTTVRATTDDKGVATYSYTDDDLGPYLTESIAKARSVRVGFRDAPPDYCGTESHAPFTSGP